jgi:hypothetical protein
MVPPTPKRMVWRVTEAPWRVEQRWRVTKHTLCCASDGYGAWRAKSNADHSVPYAAPVTDMEHGERNQTQTIAYLMLCQWRIWNMESKIKRRLPDLFCRMSFCCPTCKSFDRCCLHLSFVKRRFGVGAAASHPCLNFLTNNIFFHVPASTFPPLNLWVGLARTIYIRCIPIRCFCQGDHHT